jgi:hypothetical protein
MIRCHNWSPRTKGACHGCHPWPSRARRLGHLKEQRQGRALPLRLAKDCKGEVRGPAHHTSLLIPLGETKQHNATTVSDPRLGLCVACQVSWVVHHFGYLVPHSLLVGNRPTGQPCRSIRCGCTPRKADRHTHNPTMPAPEEVHDPRSPSGHFKEINNTIFANA